MAENPIDKFEAAFCECLSPIVANEPSTGVTYQDESRLSAEHAVTKFMDLARETEAICLKGRLTAAAKNPEFAWVQEIEELNDEIKHKDEVLKNLLIQVKQWQSRLNDIVNEKPMKVSNSSISNSQPMVHQRK